MDLKTSKKKRSKLAFPDAYVLMIGLILFSMILTYIVPGGVYERIEDVNTGRMIVQAGTFSFKDNIPVNIIELFRAIPKGLQRNAVTVFFIFIIGGAFGVVNSTGSLNALISQVIRKSKDSKKSEFIIVILIITFGLAGGVIGMAEECIVFIPIVVTLCIALGFDAIVGTAIIMLGIASGYGAATINPFTVGLAQQISGLPMFSGMWFRWIFWICTMIVLSVYMIAYCRKIKKDPTKSLVYDIDYSEWNVESDQIKDELSNKRKGVLVVFFGGIILLMILIIKYSLGMEDLTAYFLAIGILCGFIYGMTPNELSRTFVKGMSEMVYPAILVGFASSIVVVLEQGEILDTIVYSLSLVVNHLPRLFAGCGMMIMQTIINFFIPSGTGQAMVTMPLMAPLADVLNIPRQVAVLAYQMGDGFSNQIIPTLGFLMASISMAKIPYVRWFKFVLKLLILQLILGCTFLVIATYINLGPF